MRRLLPLMLALLLVLAAGCASSPRAGAPPTLFGGGRQAVLQVPVAYDGSTPRPLLVVLHGYTSSGLQQQRYFGLDSIVNKADIFLLAPDGTADERGSHFWNATDACCDLGGKGVDDVAYLKGLIAEVRDAYHIDARRIYLIGHSNGGFMALRMACEDATQIAAVVSLAGATWQDAGRCAPAEGVSVLSIHGDADRTIRYEGGAIQDHAYPGAIETMTRWSTHAGCGGSVQDPTPFDLDAAVPGDETTVMRWSGCRDDFGVELWTIQGGGHVPRLQPAFAERVWAWLAAHPKT